MGFFKVLSEIGKNNKNFIIWEKEEKDKVAQREVLKEKHEPTAEELENARRLGKNIINIIDTMDDHSESVAENVETAVAPIVSITPLLGALATGYLSYKGVLKPVSKKYEKFDKSFLQREEVKNFYQRLSEYNYKNQSKKAQVNYNVTSYANYKFKGYQKIKDSSLKAEAERLSKKYLKETSKYRKSKFGAVLAVPAAMIATFIGSIIYATKLQVDSSKIARFQARKALEDPKAFVSYTPEQIAQAKAEIESNPDLRKKTKKDEKLNQGFFKSIWRLFKDRKEYKASRFSESDNSKLVTRPLTDAELEQAERDKDVIQRTIKIINNEAEKYSENMEVASEVLINGTPFLGAGVGALLGFVFDKTGLFDKVALSSLKKNSSADTIKLFKEFKEVKRVSPLYFARFGKFMSSLVNDLENKAGSGVNNVGKGKLKPGAFKTIIKSVMTHKWIGSAVLAGISTLITGGLGLWMGLKLQKSAARAGRYTAKRELEKDPNNFIGYTQEEYNEVKDVKYTKKEESKFKTHLLFIPRVIKQYWEYDKYKRGKFREEKLLREQLMKQEVSDEQLKEAKNLQRKLFNTFEKVDDNSQIYSESTEAAVEIAQPIVQYAGLGLMVSPLLYFIVQSARGKITPAQLSSKFTGLIASLSKGGKSKIIDKYLESVNRNISNKVQGQYVTRKPLGVLLKDINFAEDSVLNLFSKSWSNLRGSTKILSEIPDAEINLEIYKMRELLFKTRENSQKWLKLFDKESSTYLTDSLNKFDKILYEIERLPKEQKIDALDILLNPKNIKNMPEERFNNAISTLENIVLSKMVDIKKLATNIVNQLPLKEFEKLVSKPEINSILKEVLTPEEYKKLFDCIKNANNAPDKLIKNVFDKETVLKLITVFEKKPQAGLSKLDKPILELLPENIFVNMHKYFEPDDILRVKTIVDDFVQKNESKILKYIDKSELDTLVKYFDKLSKYPEETLKDTTARQAAETIMSKIEKVIYPVEVPKDFQSLAKKFKLDIKLNEDGKATLGNIFAEMRKLPKNCSEFKIKDYVSFLPEKIKDPKYIINSLKTKISGMSEAEFANMLQGKFNSLDKKTTLKILTDFEKIVDNIPKDKMNEIWNTLIKEFNERPDEFIKLVKSGGVKDLIFTPELRNTLAALGISWFIFVTGMTYMIEAWLAEMQLKAGRLGVMKSLEDLNDVRYYANIEKDNV